MDEKKTTIIVWPLLIGIALLIYKNFLIEYGNSLFTNLVSDILLITILFALSIKRKSQTLQRCQNIAALLIITYHWLDLCIILSINNRLTINNVIANIEYYDAFFYFISKKITFITLGLLCLGLLLRKKTITIAYPTTFISFASYEIVFVIALMYALVNHSTKTYNNEDAINLSNNSVSAIYLSKNTVGYVKSAPPDLIQNINHVLNGQAISQPSTNSKKTNIVIVISEALSSVDSKYGGGLFNRLPKIDEIQRQGISFRQAISNGKVTAHGLGASLLGVQTTSVGGYIGMMDQFPPEKYTYSNIIKQAKDAGYKTIIVTPGLSQNFYQMQTWFKALGFDEVYNRDSAAFEGMPRFTWNAPSDADTFKFATNLIANQTSPYLIVIETVSLHQPYILPDINYRIDNNDLNNQINYIDATTSDFFQLLKSSGFYNNGVFVLYGDHRRFEGLSKEEFNNGGYAVWNQRIICTIVGKGIAPNQTIDYPTSLIDINRLLNSIIAGNSVNTTTIRNDTLATRIGIDNPFNVSLVDDTHGTYLVRSEKYKPLYLSIFGDFNLDDIPNDDYKKVAIYLIMNSQKK